MSHLIDYYTILVCAAILLISLAGYIVIAAVHKNRTGRSGSNIYIYIYRSALRSRLPN